MLARPVKQTRVADQNNLKEKRRLQRRIQGLKNLMDLIEILCNFWLLPNMTAKQERLKYELEDLFRRYNQLEGDTATTVEAPPVLVKDPSPTKAPIQILMAQSQRRAFQTSSLLQQHTASRSRFAAGMA